MFRDSITSFHYNQYSLNDSGSRINPFTNDTKEEEPHISKPQTSLNNNLLVSDHFVQPVSTLNETSSIDELTKAVKECKLKVLNLMDNEDAKNRQIKELVELNQTLHTVKEVEKSQNELNQVNIRNRSPIIRADDIKPINLAGHYLIRTRRGIGKRKYCEVCQKPIRTALATYTCSSCFVYMHSSRACLERMRRACPASNVGHPSLFPSHTISGLRYSSADSDLYIDIETFPLGGSLTSQNFLCAECNDPISPVENGSSQVSQSNFCNYYRKYYCSSCHWDNRFWIPAVYFMLNKWTKQPVCRTAYLKLKYMWKVVLFRMPLFWEQHNSNANGVLAIRLKLFRFRAFKGRCDDFKNLIEPYEDWLIEQPYLVSMQLVQNISNGSATKSVQILYSILIDHFSDCEKCKTQCKPCSLCNDTQVLYPKPGSTWSCSKCCFSVIHEICGTKNGRSELEFVCDNCSQA